MIPPPPHLSPAAQAVWAEVAAGIHEAKAKAQILEAYCVQVARMRDAQARIDAEGLIVAGPKGLPVPHPALAIERGAAGEVLHLRAALRYH